MTANVLGFDRPPSGDRCGAPCPCGGGYRCALGEGHQAVAHSALVVRQSSPVGVRPQWYAQYLHVWIMARPEAAG